MERLGVLELPHRVICAWCEAEGDENVLQAGIEPTSHGICESHARAFLVECERSREARGLDVA